MTALFTLCFFITCAVFTWFAITTLRGQTRKTAPPEEVYIPTPAPTPEAPQMTEREEALRIFILHHRSVADEYMGMAKTFGGPQAQEALAVSKYHEDEANHLTNELRALQGMPPLPDFVPTRQPEPRKIFTTDRVMLAGGSVLFLLMGGIPGVVIFLVGWWVCGLLPWPPLVSAAMAGVLFGVFQGFNAISYLPPKAAPAAVIDLPIEPWLAKEEAHPCLRPSCDMRTGSD